MDGIDSENYLRIIVKEIKPNGRKPHVTARLLKMQVFNSQYGLDYSAQEKLRRIG